MQTDLKAIYSPLAEGEPDFGSAALFPWDQRMFGFPVGGYQMGEAALIAGRREAFVAALRGWADARQAELLACNLPADQRGAQHLLQACGFHAVDYQLAVNLSAAAMKRLPRPILTVRRADPADRATVMQIAEAAFDVGRYHADPRFPRRLADLRYRLWIENAFAGSDDRVYVVDEGDGPLAFMHLVCSGDLADLRLAAVAPGARGGNVGYGLFVGVLDLLRQEQIRQARSKISSANVAIINLYAVLGFRFESPEMVLHWHWPLATHLVDPAQAGQRTAGNLTP